LIEDRKKGEEELIEGIGVERGLLEKKRTRRKEKMKREEVRIGSLRRKRK
jgi:hypothetical protein